MLVRPWARAARSLPAVCLVACVLSATGCGVAVAHPPGRASDPNSLTGSRRRSGPDCPPFVKRTIHIFDAGAPGGARYAQIFTPAVAHPERLPVLYFLHGYPGGGDNIGDGPTAATLHAQICAGAKPFILVAPDGKAADRSDPEWADAADGRFDIESFVTGPLIATVEGPHRRPASLRAIAGFSMGAFGAADLGLRHPTLYRQFVAIGGYYTIDDPSGTFGHSPGAARTADRRAHEPLLLAGAGTGMRVLLAAGTHETQKLYAGQVARFAPALRNAGASVQTLTVTSKHTYAMVKAVIPAMVQFLEVGWAQPSAA